ncbi:hypothetical protein AB3M80_22790 [Arthrospira platensis BEA 1257B]
MIQQAIVTTSGDVLNVRSSPYGPVIDTVEPGTVVEVIGTPVPQGGLTWVPIGGDRWVSREFLTVHNPTTETDDHLANTIGQTENCRYSNTRDHRWWSKGLSHRVI